ncbi:transcriptional regulator [Erwinia tasmaniensis]|nr:transcriptional regulator [Erwinia tasmaniensis]
MMYQCLLFDKNIYFSQGIKTALLNSFEEGKDVFYSATDDYGYFLENLKKKVKDDCRMWVFCDLDSLPQERFRALNVIKDVYQHENKKLIIVLSKHNMPLFSTLYTLLPDAHWLLKSEEVKHIKSFFLGLFEKKGNESRFSFSLVNDTRNKLRSGDVNYTISSHEWWLIEELLKGKSLSEISDEVGVNIRRLSYVKRLLMKRLNIKNNIALFEVVKEIIP